LGFGLYDIGRIIKEKNLQSDTNPVYSTTLSREFILEIMKLEESPSLSIEEHHDYYEDREIQRLLHLSDYTIFDLATFFEVDWTFLSRDSVSDNVIMNDNEETITEQVDPTWIAEKLYEQAQCDDRGRKQSLIKLLEENADSSRGWTKEKVLGVPLMVIKKKGKGEANARIIAVPKGNGEQERVVILPTHSEDEETRAFKPGGIVETLSIGHHNYLDQARRDKQEEYDLFDYLTKIHKFSRSLRRIPPESSSSSSSTTTIITATSSLVSSSQQVHNNKRKRPKNKSTKEMKE